VYRVELSAFYSSQLNRTKCPVSDRLVGQFKSNGQRANAALRSRVINFYRATHMHSTMLSCNGCPCITRALGLCRNTELIIKKYCSLETPYTVSQKKEHFCFY